MAFAVLATVALCGCAKRPWNNPDPAALDDQTVLHTVFTTRPKHLDPASSYGENEVVFTAQIYEPVLQYHFLKRPYTLVPLTATALPEPLYLDHAGHVLPANSADTAITRVVYRIQIKPGILFQPHPAFARDAGGNYLYHAGTQSEPGVHRTLADFKESGTRELTAADYVYQIKRLANPQLHSPIAGLMGKYIAGLNELATRLRAAHSPPGAFIDLRDYDLEGAKVIDRYTYEIILTERYPQFVYWLAMPFFAPVPWEAEAFYSQPEMKEHNLNLDWYPVGTGPYLLAENNPNRRMILQRNPNFRGEPYPGEGMPGDAERGLLKSAGKPMPFIDTVYFNLEKEDIPLWSKFLQGYYDMSPIVSDGFDQAIEYSATGEAELTPQLQQRGVRLSTAVEPAISYLGFNMRDPVVGGDGERARLLRRALSIAFDIEEMISIFANGVGEAAQGPIPPGIFGYQQGQKGVNPFVYEWAGDHPRRRAIEEAKTLLVQAGYPDGRDPATQAPLVLYFDAYDNGPDVKSQLNWYRKQFAKLGIELVIRATDYNQFQDKVRKGDAQIFSWGWSADYPDPENFLFLLYGPNGKVLHQGENATNYHNAEFDQLFLKMRLLPNGPERQAVIDRMLALVRRDAPWIWGFHPKSYSLYHRWYGNAYPNMMARNTIKYRTLDPLLRAGLQQAWNQPVVWPIVLVLVALVLGSLPAYRSYRRHQEARAL